MERAVSTTTGNIRNIDLGLSLFEDIITKGNFYVDKTRLIERFLTSNSTVSLVARQRRLGKSLNMDTLRCFLTDKEDLRNLFKGLFIESSSVREMANSAPVFYFDFKGLNSGKYKMLVYDMIIAHIEDYCDENDLPRSVRRYVSNEDFDNPEGLRYLTEVIYKATGKRSYLLIDEYDKLLIDNRNNEAYEEIRSFLTALFSSALKGNQYLEKALLTGVMRISHESMFSGLNNIVTFDVFNDNTYMDDYGFTEEEIQAIGRITELDTAKLRQWYNGVRINGKPIYNTYSVMSYLREKDFLCYWGKSGTMDIITDMLDGSRMATLAKLMIGEQVLVPMADRVSVKNLVGKGSDQAFYSLLVQAGYLALCGRDESKISSAIVSIPNTELMLVWKNFILDNLYPNSSEVLTLFDNADNLKVFAKDFEYFVQDRLSFHDLAVPKSEELRKHHELIYHVFILGILSAYKDVRCMFPLSNRESGDGRYDILVEKPSSYYVFELKVCGKEDDLDAYAKKALSQISLKRYGADLEKSKRLVKVGIAFCGKKCKVRVSEVNNT